MGLIRILVLALLGFLAYSVFRRVLDSSGKRQNPTPPDERLGRLVQDPNCGVWVDNKEAVRRKVAGGDLFFCSKECAEAHLGGKSQNTEEQPSEETDQKEV